MAVSAGTAYLDVAPRIARTFSRDLTTQMVRPMTAAGTRAGERAGDESGRRFGLRFNRRLGSGFSASTGIARKAAGGIAAAFAAVQVAGFLKGAIDEAREAAKVGRQTEAVIRATGGAANVTAKDVDRLATALSNKVGVDDEAIASSANLLLTFRGVRNEAGRGNDVFNQAQTAIVDMTAAMNNGTVTQEGLKTSTIQVGKALNDPIKGMTALSRVGVTFTQGQKDQIKAMVEAGDKMGAQRIILKELKTEFGGAAAAASDPWQRFGVVMGNLKEQIGTALLPVLTRVATFLADNLPKALQTVGGWFSRVKLGVLALGAAFSGEGVTSDGFVGVMEHIGVALRSVWDWVRRAATAVMGVLGPAFRSIADAMRPAIAAFVKALLPGLKTLWHVIQTQVWPALKILAAVIGVALYGALRYVLPILLKIAGPVLGFFFRQLGITIQWISNVIRWIGRIGAALLRWITGTKTTGDAIRRLADTAKAQFAFIARIFLTLVGTIISGAARAFGWIPGLGPKLRTAADKFAHFKDQVNASLNRLTSKKVTVTATFGINTPPGVSVHDIVGATGGYVTGRAIVPRRLHRGGFLDGPGTETSDSIPARLSKGEYVVRAKAVKAMGRQAMDWINAQGFAGGGGVDLATNLASPSVMGRAVAGFDRLIDRMIASLAKAWDKAAGQGRPGVLNFIRSVDPLPYVWGGVGPGGYDCSGLVGEVMARHLGLPSHRRYFTTSSIHSGMYGLRPGLGGVLQIGVTAGTGHMAGRYAGLGFEAESSRTGIKIGSAASPPESFARHYALARGGPIDPRWLALFGRKVDIGGDPGRLRINGKVLDTGIFDRGGWLAPHSTTLLANRTRHWERVSPPGETGIHVTVNLNGPVLGAARQVARELAPELETQLRKVGYQSGRR